MARFVITEHPSAPARAVFAHLVDWDAHSAAIPLTRLVHEGVPAAGQAVVARTGSRRLGFDDPMMVQVLRTPAGDAPGDAAGLVEMTKVGHVISGSVSWTVTPAATGSVVRWTQELLVPWLPRRLDPLVGIVGRAAYRAGLRRLLRGTDAGEVA
jgi:hypothetical protein